MTMGCEKQMEGMPDPQLLEYIPVMQQVELNCVIDS